MTISNGMMRARAGALLAFTRDAKARKKARGDGGRSPSLALRHSILGSLFLPVSLCAAPEPEAFRTREYRAMGGLDLINASQAYAMGYTGKGVRVGVVDDGGALDHPEFAGRAGPWGGAASHDGFGEGQPAGEHSTSVAGVLGAARDGVGMHGVAYDASLIALGHDHADAEDSATRIREAVDMGAKVINASYGPVVYPNMRDDKEKPNPGYTPQALQTLFFEAGALVDLSTEVEAVRYAIAQDALIVYAAGNDYDEHPQAASHPSGGALLPFIKPQHHAAGVYRHVDLVGMGMSAEPESWDELVAMDPNDPRLRSLDFSDLEGGLIAAVAVGPDKRAAVYSNRCGVAWRWCIAAPGGDYPGPAEPWWSRFLLTSALGGEYTVSLGTSLAAPIVAGSAAVLRQAFPYMTARQIVEVLLTSADRSGHLADRAIYGRGLLDLGRAVRGPVEFGAEGYAPIFDVDTKGHDSGWHNDIGGRGGLTKRGAGTLTLTGVNHYSGPTAVKGGTLAVQGSIAESVLTVERGGTLSGTGIVGPTEVSGTVAPAHPGKALRVAGDYVQRAEGVYVLGLSDDGLSSDQISARGAARIENGALQVMGIGPNAIGREFTILHADGGVEGGFAPVQNPYLFLDLAHGRHTPDPTRYQFSVRRNATAFATAARTANQASVAGALDSAGAGFAPYDATVMATGPEGLARQFDLWSGEAHASMLSVLNTQSGRVGEAALARARTMQSPDAALRAASQTVVENGEHKAVWAQYTGSRDRLSGNSNAASLDASSSGLLFGTDVAMTPATRLGALAGFANGSVRVQDRRSTSKLDSYVLGMYGSTRLDALSLRYGTSYSWHTISARRDTGRLQTAEGRYKAHTWQLFGEAGVPYQFGAVTLEPYAGLSYSDTRLGAFTESGKAGLRAEGANQQLVFSTLGVRAGSRWQLRDESQLSLHGGAGWRRAYGDIDPAARMRFAQGDSFQVDGMPVARDALLVEAGVGVESRAGMRLGLGYSGQLARGAQSHAIKANMSWPF